MLIASFLCTYLKSSFLYLLTIQQPARHSSQERYNAKKHRKPIRKKIVAIILSTAVMVLLFGATANPAHAATFIVSSLADAGAGTLREAISFATSGTDTIKFSVSGTITLISGQLTINSALTSLIIDGTGQTITISGGSGSTRDRVFCAVGTTTLTINALTITNGQAKSTCDIGSSSGGGIYSNGPVTVTNSTFSSNLANSGAGIRSNNAVTVTNSTFSGNTATNDGGGITSVGGVTVTNSAFSDNKAANDGGGIFSFAQPFPGYSGTVTVTNSTFDSNLSSGYGGGIYSNGAVTVINSTLSGNEAVSGGGLFVQGTLTVTNSTFFGNKAGITGGGGITTRTAVTVTVTNSTFSGSGNNAISALHAVAVTLTNTIITLSTYGNCYGGAPTTITNSLIDDATCGGASLGTVTGLSATLANNGGPTQTLALLAGSNAIDGVPTGQCTVATDQRGIARPQGSLCDIGAYEFVPPTVTSGPVLQSCYQPNGSLVTSVKINVPTVTANGSAATIFCQILTDPAQYNVTNQSVTLAIDVFALTAGGQSVTAFSTPVQVCLQGSGALLFRDATGSPRVTKTLNGFSSGGYTCGSIPNAGTLILITGMAAPAGNVGGGAAVASHPLTGCLVTTLYGLNLHSAPDVSSSKVGFGVPPNVTLTATDRVGDWVKITYGADTGWLSIPNDLTLNLNCN